MLGSREAIILPCLISPDSSVSESNLSESRNRRHRHHHRRRRHSGIGSVGRPSVTCWGRHAGRHVGGVLTTMLPGMSAGLHGRRCSRLPSELEIEPAPGAYNLPPPDAPGRPVQWSGGDSAIATISDRASGRIWRRSPAYANSHMVAPERHYREADAADRGA